MLEIFAAMDASQNKFRQRLSFIGARRGGRIIIKSLCKLGQPQTSASDSSTIVGEMVFHPDRMYWLRPSEKRRVAELLKEKEEFTFVVSRTLLRWRPGLLPRIFLGEISAGTRHGADVRWCHGPARPIGSGKPRRTKEARASRIQTSQPKQSAPHE
jgi:hypothetical protein